MTNPVTNLDDQRPHYAGPMICLRCFDKSINVRPVAMDEPCECGSCGARRVWSLDGMLGNVDEILGGECCGDVDSQGVCASPACLYGETRKLVHAISDMIEAEYGQQKDKS